MHHAKAWQLIVQFPFTDSKLYTFRFAEPYMVMAFKEFLDCLETSLDVYGIEYCRKVLLDAIEWLKNNINRKKGRQRNICSNNKNKRKD